MYVHTQVLQKMSYVHACHMSWRDEIPPVAFWVQHALFCLKLNTDIIARGID